MTDTPRRSNRFLLATCAAALAYALLAAGAAPAAAQGSPAASPASLDTILKAVSAWNSGIESAAIWQLRDYVYARKDDAAGRAECEAALLRFLKTPATPSAKLTAARFLRVVAGDTAVPALQAMLADPRSADYAIYVLQQLPGPAAEGALVQALKSARGTVKAGIVTALGERRSSGALPVVVLLLSQPEFNVAAATAIGRIGGPAAAAALTAAYPAAQVPFKRTLAPSMIAVAESLQAAKNPEGALAVYRMVSSDRSLPAPVRRAAFMGEIDTAAEGAAGLVLTMLDSTDPDEQQAAVARIADAVPAQGIGRVCERLPRLPELLQIPVLAVLTGYPGDRVRPAVLEAARSQSPAVRIAALHGLDSVGDASVVPFLVERAAVAGKGLERDAARRALGMLKGRAVDDAILAMLGQKQPPAAAGELMKAVADRRVFLAKPAVAAALQDPSPAVRAGAFEALRAIGTPSDVSPVLDVLLRSGDDAERADAEKTVAALLQKTGSPDGRSRMVRMRLVSETDTQTRVRLINLLPLTGDDSALPILRTALASASLDEADAAARALASWPTVTARDDVWKLARDSNDETHRLLAIGSLVRLVGLEPFRRPEAAIADLKQASGLAWRPEERKLVLGALAAFPCKDALDLATGFLQDADVKAEAQAAIDTITPKLKKVETR
jgi:HEAT repeat protein